MHLSPPLVGILALCLEGLSAFSAEPVQGVLRLSATVPFVFYSVAENGLCVRMQGAVWVIVCLTLLRRNIGEKLQLPRP